MTMLPKRGVPERSGHRRARYEDDYDEIDIGRRRHRRERLPESPTLAGMYGFLAALSSLGLLAVVTILYIFLKQEEGNQQPNLEQTRWMYYWFLILDAVSFFAGMTATILGARGISPTNPLYRGYGVAALVLGIIEMVVTFGFGIWMTCAALLVEIQRAGG